MTDWLTEDEQHAWRGWLTASHLLYERLGQELQEQFGMSMGDYDILVHLSESPEHRLRMSELADVTLASRSRLSHQVDRMERAGTVRREFCEEDRRGLFAVLTDKGMAALEEAAPAHVEGVRRHLFDLLSGREVATVAKVCDKVVNGLAEDS